MLEKLNILYLHGLGSSIHNRTGTALVKHFKDKNVYFERLQYSNPGSVDKVWRISEWIEDTKKRIAGGDWVLIATSAGGNCALHVAREMPKNVRGLFLFCPGSGLSLSYVDQLAPGALQMLKDGQKLIHPASRNGYPALVDLYGFQEYLAMCVTKEPGTIPINCPVHIVHGTADDTVPYQNSFKLKERLASKDVAITIIKDGTHYLEIDDFILSKVDNFMQKMLTTRSKI